MQRTEFITSSRRINPLTELSLTYLVQGFHYIYQKGNFTMFTFQHAMMQKIEIFLIHDLGQ